MKPVALNRLSVVLSFIGFAIAGLLSLEKGLGLELPCGTDAGCSVVSQHPSAYWLDLPVAWYGAIGWLGILILAVMRQSGNLKDSAGSLTFASILTLIGSLVSVYLQVVSFTVIKAFCPYCFTQALTMLLSFGVTLALLGTVRRSSEDDPELQMGKGWLPGIAILSALTGVFLFVSISNAKAAVGGVSYLSPSVANSVELVPKDAYIYGDLNAPITVVEFADICCPSCQLTSPKMHEYVNQNNGRVRWVYRHFPLPSHTMAIPAAVAAEYAGQEGRYYEFLEIVMRGLNGQIPDNPGPIQGAIRAANLDVEKFESLIGDSKNPVYERIARDRNAAVELGIDSTPTFIVLAAGKPPKVARGDRVFEVLQSEEYKNIGRSEEGKK